MIWTSWREEEQTGRQTDTGCAILRTRDIGMVRNIEHYKFLVINLLLLEKLLAKFISFTTLTQKTQRVLKYLVLNYRPAKFLFTSEKLKTKFGQHINMILSVS